MLREQCVEMIFDNDGEWQKTKEHYEKLGYKIVDWDINYGKKEFYLKAFFVNNNTIENKIDYDREYSIHEAIEFPERTEFEVYLEEDRLVIKFENGFLMVKDDDYEKIW
ncbi:hypothetical protein, partial [Clostridium botulinum]